MPKSLADLRASRPQSRPERAYTVCLAQHLVAEVGTLTEELQSIAVRAVKADDEDHDDGPPKRLGEGDPPRAEEIRTRLRELLDEMAEYEGELRVRATRTDGDWRRWTNEHPARDEDEPGHKRDQEVTGGFCNADALIDDLGTYAWSWNGERLEAGDWDVLGVSPADQKRIGTLVVSLYESDASIPKWRSALSENLRSESA
jgi:hypothetical protein